MTLSTFARCPFCPSEDSNCGHVLLNAIRLPARFITPPFMESVELGHRAPRLLSQENTGSKFRREESIARRAS